MGGERGRAPSAEAPPGGQAAQTRRRQRHKMAAAAAGSAAAAAGAAPGVGGLPAAPGPGAVLIGDRLYSGVLITLENCLLPETTLRFTPSMSSGLDADTETELRVTGCELIQAAGILLRLPQVSRPGRAPLRRRGLPGSARPLSSSAASRLAAARPCVTAGGASWQA